MQTKNLMEFWEISKLCVKQGKSDEGGEARTFLNYVSPKVKIVSLHNIKRLTFSEQSTRKREEEKQIYCKKSNIFPFIECNSI